jgi:hypothetical protein
MNVAEIEIIAITMFSSTTTRHGWNMLSPSDRKRWRDIAKTMLDEAQADFVSPFPNGHIIIKNPDDKSAFTGFNAGARARRESGIGQRNHKKPLLIGIPPEVESMSASFFHGFVEPSVLRVGMTRAKEILVFDASLTMLEAIKIGWKKVEKSLTEDVYRIQVYNVGESDAGYTTLMQIRDDDGMVTDEVDAGDFDDPISAETSVGERGGRIVTSIWDEQAQDAQD